MTCLVSACPDGRHYSKGYCRYHYERQRRGQRLDVQRRTWNHGGAICSQPECDVRAKAKGYCELHYRRARNGLPLDMRKRQAALFVCIYGDCDSACGRSMLCPTHLRRIWTRTHGASRRARKRELFVEHVDIDVLRQRDDGVCGICREPVDAWRQWPDPMSQSIDHVIPLSLNGEHSYCNTQIAHVSCNASKGNRISAKESA